MTSQPLVQTHTKQLHFIGGVVIKFITRFPKPIHTASYFFLVELERREEDDEGFDDADEDRLEVEEDEAFSLPFSLSA